MVSVEQRRALVLYHLCNLTVDQIAAETGARAGTVKARPACGPGRPRALPARNGHPGNRVTSQEVTVKHAITPRRIVPAYHVLRTWLTVLVKGD
jgi:hypothetical protein